MRRSLYIFLLCFLAVFSSFAQTVFQKDFDFYLQTVEDNFAYFHRQKTGWKKVKVLYQPLVDTVSTETGFLHFLESVNNELYNGHVFLNRNTAASNRTIPSGSDMKISWINKKFVITELRQEFNAGDCGLRTGMEVVKFDSYPVLTAIQKFLPRSVAKVDKDMIEYAANMLFAGTHNRERVVTTIVNGKEKIFYPDSLPNKTEKNHFSLLNSSRLAGNIGYIRINNSLGEKGLIAIFDHALDSLLETNGLIIDLRETPGGGNTTIARAIMGRFTGKELAYQKHVYSAEEKETGIKRSALELVSPRGNIYKKPLVVLVGYWTGSMGEGIAIGFDGMKRATIAGTAMAGLLGEIYTFNLPATNIPFSFPCVQLQHINGTPREDYLPAVILEDQRTAIESARKLLVSNKVTGLR